MEPITLRVPEELDEELTEEATSEGFASRAAYIRYLLQRHPDRTGTDTDPNTQRMRSDIDSNTSRLDDLEDRIADLEGGGESHTPTPPRPRPLTARRGPEPTTKGSAIVSARSYRTNAHHTFGRRYSTWSNSSRMRASSRPRNYKTDCMRTTPTTTPHHGRFGIRLVDMWSKSTASNIRTDPKNIHRSDSMVATTRPFASYLDTDE